MKKYLLAAIFFALAGFAQAQDVRVSYSGPAANIVIGAPFQQFAPGSPQTFLLTVAPQSAITIFVTNLGAGTHALTITPFITGSQSVANYSSNTQWWIPLTTTILPAGATATSQVLSIGPGATIAMGSSILSASQVAITLSTGSASTDQVSVYAVLTPNGLLGTQQVQGLVANGANASGINPVMIGGMDPSNTARFVRVDSCNGSALPECLEMFETGQTNSTLLSQGQTSSATLSAQASPPLAVAVYDAQVTFTHITAAATTNVTTAGTARTDLKRIVVNTGVAGTAQVWTNACTTGTEVAVINTGTPFVYEYDLQLSTGLCILTSAAADLTVVYAF